MSFAPVGDGSLSQTMVGFLARPGSDTNSFRRTRFRRVRGLIDQVVARQGHCRIIDIGGTPSYWRPFKEELRGRNIDLLIVNRFPQQDESGWSRCIVGNATDLGQLADHSFDLVHSNSVIEHVGSWRDITGMAREVRRLAPSYYLQTPNFWFPFEPHARTLFFHWMPVPMRLALIRRRRCGYYAKAADMNEAMACIEDARCLSQAEMRFLFPDARLAGEKVFGLVKSWIAIREPG